MTPEEIKQFKREVADPRIQEIFANTEIPMGACYIDSLNIEFLDGRSCGVESVIEAHGMIAKADGIEEYVFSAQDISVADFAEQHRNCLFLSDGALRVFDQLADLEINSKMWNCERCEKIFEDLAGLQELSFVSQDFVYLKMKAILCNDPLLQQEDQKDEPVTLNNAAAIEYKGIIFDDWCVDVDGVWAEICEDCANKYMDRISSELDDSGAIGTCSVNGCAVRGLDTENKHHYYIDFIPDLIHPLSKQELATLINQSKDASAKATLSQQINMAAEQAAEKNTHAIQPERDDR